MNIIISILFTIVSLLLAIILPILCMIFFQFRLLHFSLFLIIPVGGMAIGYLASYGYFKTLSLRSVGVNKKHFFISMVLSILCIIGIQYSSYKLASIAPNGKDIIYSLEGQHLADGYRKMDFVQYNEYIVENTPVNFGYKSFKLFQVNNKTVLWVLYLINIIGVIIGGIWSSGTKTKQNKPYCSRCRKYKKKKELFKVEKNTGDKLIRDMEDINYGINTSDSISSLLSRYNLNRDVERVPHYLCTLVYCDECRTSSLVFQLYDTTKSKISKKDDNKYEMRIDYHYAEDFLVK